MQLSKRNLLAVTCALFVLAASWPVLAQGTKGLPITADQAFDAVQMHKDPATGAIKQDTTFFLVDIRTRAEVKWVGTAAMVTKITFKDGKTVVPDFGKVKLEHDGMFIVYDVHGRNRRTLTREVLSMMTAPIAYNIPVKTWDEGTGAMLGNDGFQRQINSLAASVKSGDPKPVLILFCRSGDRTDTKILTSLFQAIYEIDLSTDYSGYGGFEGSLYIDPSVEAPPATLVGAFNGYRGFPGRDTLADERPSASWKDAGLPIIIGLFKPTPVSVQ